SGPPGSPGSSSAAGAWAAAPGHRRWRSSARTASATPRGSGAADQAAPWRRWKEALLLGSLLGWSTGVRLVELTPEGTEATGLNSLSNRLHGVKVKVQIMHRVQCRGAHFPGKEQVAQVGAGVTAAGRAAALGVGRQRVARVLCVPDHDRTAAREQLAVARVARREHAVEHIDAARNALDQVERRADPHQVAR